MITAAGEVEVRLVSYESALLELPCLKPLLSDEELQRGNRLLDQRVRDRFFVGRGVLRVMLAEQLNVSPRTIALAQGEFGKLHLADGGRDGIRFNVSHAGDYLLLVFAAGCEVGCDLEQLRQDLPFRAMAERYFSPREREELFGLQPDQQLAAFYRCWTRKEAYLKATGTGFSQLCTDFDVSLLPHHAPELISHRSNPAERTRWSITDLEVPAGYCAALAVENLL